MILVIEQPSYVPWLGYFDLMSKADVWVWYDDVQYTRRDWRSRNRIARDGEPVWLTVPVRSRHRREQLIGEATIDTSLPWARKHLQTFRHCYGRAPWYAPTYDLLRRHVERPYERLADLDIDLAEAIARWLGVRPRFLRSSGLPAIGGRKQDRLLAICRALGADVYLSGPNAESYIEPHRFAAEGVELRYIVYDYPPYERGGFGFVPALSILDPLAWIGPQRTRELLAARCRTAMGAGG
jgi:hypothetical protein